MIVVLTENFWCPAIRSCAFYLVRHIPDRRRAIHKHREPPSRRAPVAPDLQVTKAGSRDTYHPKKRK